MKRLLICLMLLACGGPTTERPLLAADFSQAKTLKGHALHVLSVVFSPDGKLIVSGSGDKTLKIWDAETGQELETLKGHSEPIIAVLLSPDGKLIVSGSLDKTLIIWDANSGKKMQKLEGHIGPVFSVAFSPDGLRIISGGDFTVKVWDGQSLITNP